MTEKERSRIKEELEFTNDLEKLIIKNTLQDEDQNEWESEYEAENGDIISEKEIETNYYTTEEIDYYLTAKNLIKAGYHKLKEDEIIVKKSS